MKSTTKKWRQLIITLRLQQCSEQFKYIVSGGSKGALDIFLLDGGWVGRGVLAVVIVTVMTYWAREIWQKIMLLNAKRNSGSVIGCYSLKSYSSGVFSNCWTGGIFEVRKCNISSSKIEKLLYPVYLGKGGCMTELPFLDLFCRILVPPGIQRSRRTSHRPLLAFSRILVVSGRGYWLSLDVPSRDAAECVSAAPDSPRMGMILVGLTFSSTFERGLY